jgi:hypothetical protein
MRSGRTHFANIRPEDQEMVRAAARRSGLSVSEWLDRVITQAAAEEGTERAANPRSDMEAGESTLRAVHARIDELAGRIERLAQHAAWLSPSVNDGAGQLLRLEYALNRLTERLCASMLEPVDPVYQYQQGSGRGSLLTRLLAPRN